MAAKSNRRLVYAHRAPTSKSLFCGVDHGSPIPIKPDAFFSGDLRAGWGAFAEPFVRLNESALKLLGLHVELKSTQKGVSVYVTPGHRAGAIPLRSAQTGHVVAGLLIKPRFGWPGIGRVLTETGWHASPQIHDLPMVPGSGREIPPWVLGGPVLTRIEALLQKERRGYREKEEILGRPRGRILWPQYTAQSLARGQWDQLPCRFPDLGFDLRLRQQMRWVVERVYQDLIRVGSGDVMAVNLASRAKQLALALSDVEPIAPRRDELTRSLDRLRLSDETLRLGIEAMAWVVEERGLGGGRERDGMAWSLPLEQLWEGYVESVIRREAAVTGGDVRVGRLGETTFPVHWSDPLHRSLGHLVPDIVVRRGRSVQIVDAKYKAHLAELDEDGWRRFTEEAREAHRADIHQILGYAALFDADEITATLVYPLRLATWEALKEQGRDISHAELVQGGRRLRLELRGLPFGRVTRRA